MLPLFFLVLCSFMGGLYVISLCCVLCFLGPAGRCFVDQPPVSANVDEAEMSVWGWSELPETAALLGAGTVRVRRRQGIP